jgi:hypothetical protein
MSDLGNRLREAFPVEEIPAEMVAMLDAAPNALDAPAPRHIIEEHP